MRFRDLKIPKSEFDQLSIEERIFFIQISHLMNELSILQKCVIASNNRNKSLTKIQQSAQTAQSLFFVKILTGKLNEGWEMLSKSYFKTKLSKKYDSLLSDNAKKNLSELKKYFNGNNIIRDIRKKYSFHYDSKEIQRALSKVPYGEPITTVVSKHVGNTFFEFSETIANRALLSSIDPQDHQKAMDVFFDEVVINVSGWFRKFGHGFVVALFEQLRFHETEVNITNIPNISEIELPFFVEKER